MTVKLQKNGRVARKRSKGSILGRQTVGAVTKPSARYFMIGKARNGKAQLVPVRLPETNLLPPIQSETILLPGGTKMQVYPFPDDVRVAMSNAIQEARRK